MVSLDIRVANTVLCFSSKPKNVTVLEQLSLQKVLLDLFEI